MTMTTLGPVERGDVVTATATFRDSAGTLTNPTAVTFYVRTGQGASTEADYVYGTDSEVTRPDTGVYVLTLPIAAQRTHVVRVVGTGAVAAAALGKVVVEYDRFTT